LPLAGFELANEAGEIVASAELAWPSCRFAVLLDHEVDGTTNFEIAGWRVFVADEVRIAPESLLEILPDEVSE
jgi:hypothetical protein